MHPNIYTESLLHSLSLSSLSLYSIFLWVLNSFWKVFSIEAIYKKTTLFTWMPCSISFDKRYSLLLFQTLTFTLQFPPNKPNKPLWLFKKFKQLFMSVKLRRAALPLTSDLSNQTPSWRWFFVSFFPRQQATTMHLHLLAFLLNPSHTLAVLLLSSSVAGCEENITSGLTFQLLRKCSQPWQKLSKHFAPLQI